MLVNKKRKGRGRGRGGGREEDEEDEEVEEEENIASVIVSYRHVLTNSHTIPHSIKVTIKQAAKHFFYRNSRKFAEQRRRAA
jgi:hypothetical protein